jgi:hypothetical protein
MFRALRWLSAKPVALAVRTLTRTRMIEAEMRKSLVTTIAAAALIAGAGLAKAQQTQPTPDVNQDQTPGMASPSKAEPGTIKKNPASEGKSASVQDQTPGMASASKAEPGTIKKNPAREGKSASVMKKHHYGKHAAMKSTAEGRSVTTKNNSGSAKSPSSGAY